MTTEIKIGGIYDKRTLSTLLKSDNVFLGFDFRPKSFNFLQQHKFNELLADLYQSNKKVLLKFSNEKQFVIKKFFTDIEQKIGFVPAHFYLELSGDLDMEHEKQYELNFPVYYHLSLIDPVIPTYLLKNLRGVILNTLDFQDKSDEEILKLYKNLIAKYPAILNLDVGLNLNWNSSFSFSQSHFFDLKFISIEINNLIETCYRNIDLNKLEDGLNSFSQILTNDSYLLSKNS